MSRTDLQIERETVAKNLDTANLGDAYGWGGYALRLPFAGVRYYGEDCSLVVQSTDTQNRVDRMMLDVARIAATLTGDKVLCLMVFSDLKITVSLGSFQSDHGRHFKRQAIIASGTIRQTQRQLSALATFAENNKD